MGSVPPGVLVAEVIPGRETVAACLRITGGLPDYFTKDSLSEMGEDLWKSRLYVAGETKIGFSVVRDDVAEDRAEILWMAVRREWQRQGIGPDPAHGGRSEILEYRTARSQDPRRGGRLPAIRSDPAVLRKGRLCTLGDGRSVSWMGARKPVCDLQKDAVMDKVNLEHKLALFDGHWSPKVVGELNGQHVKLVKLLGEFVWHHHDAEDELFLVVRGRFRMEFRDHDVWVEEGEFIVVPRGIEHRPVAEEEAHVMLFEPASTLNTGNVRDESTVEELDRI